MSDPRIAEHSARFFKTGPGEYGEGDRFRGIRVPTLRKLSRRYGQLALLDVERLLASPWHEDRLIAVLILVLRFRAGDAREQGAIYRSYVRNMRFVNNWDIVDASAPDIVGGFLLTRSRKKLDVWAHSANLWQRRVAVLATLRFTREEQYDDTLRLARELLGDEQDLIHKAVGWMLREVGKRDERPLCTFLDRHAAAMPRTMLRYSIERLSAVRRKTYMRASL